MYEDPCQPFVTCWHCWDPLGKPCLSGNYKYQRQFTETALFPAGFRIVTLSLSTLQSRQQHRGQESLITVLQSHGLIRKHHLVQRSQRLLAVLHVIIITATEQVLSNPVRVHLKDARATVIEMQKVGRRNLRTRHFQRL